MQVSVTGKSHWILFVKCGVAVLKISLVLVNLSRGMKYIAVITADKGDHLVAERFATSIPLLEFDNHRKVGPDPVAAGDNAIEPLAGLRKLIFEHDSVIFQVSDYKTWQIA